MGFFSEYGPHPGRGCSHPVRSGQGRAGGSHNRRKSQRRLGEVQLSKTDLNWHLAVEQWVDALRHIKEIEEELSQHFMFNLLLKKVVLNDKLGEMVEIYNNWPLPKESINEYYLEMLKNDEIFNTYDVFGENIYTKETITQSGYWELLKKVGLEKEAEQILKEK